MQRSRKKNRKRIIKKNRFEENFSKKKIEENSFKAQQMRKKSKGNRERNFNDERDRRKFI